MCVVGWLADCRDNQPLTLISGLKQLKNVGLRWNFKVFDLVKNMCFTSNFGKPTYTTFSYLLLFQTWPRATRTLRPWSRAPCTPRGPCRWRSRHRTLSPTLHCRKPPPDLRSVSASPQRDGAGSQVCQGLTGQCTVHTCTAKRTRHLGAAWCRRMEENLKRRWWDKWLSEAVSSWILWHWTQQYSWWYIYQGGYVFTPCLFVDKQNFAKPQE